MGVDLYMEFFVMGGSTYFALKILNSYKKCGPNHQKKPYKVRYRGRGFFLVF